MEARLAIQLFRVSPVVESIKLRFAISRQSLSTSTILGNQSARLGTDVYQYLQYCRVERTVGVSLNSLLSVEMGRPKKVCIIGSGNW